MVASKLMGSCLVLLILFLQAPLNSCSSWRLPGLLLNADDSEEPIRARYEHWITRHGRRYRDGNEKEQRFQVYRSNVQLIGNFNSLGLGFYLIDNKFADLTNEEFRAKISCLGPPPKHKHEFPKGVEVFLQLHPSYFANCFTLWRVIN